MAKTLKIKVSIELDGMKIEVPEQFDLTCEGMSAESVAAIAERFAERLKLDLKAEDERLSPQGSLFDATGKLPAPAESERAGKSSPPSGKAAAKKPVKGAAAMKKAKDAKDASKAAASA